MANAVNRLVTIKSLYTDGLQSFYARFITSGEEGEDDLKRRGIFDGIRLMVLVVFHLKYHQNIWIPQDMDGQLWTGKKKKPLIYQGL